MSAGYDPTAYGATFAGVYDAVYEEEKLTQTTCEVLAGLADGGPVLELGVGTGRVALPLADRGLDVTGVDASQEMLDVLAAKPGAEQVRTVRADLRDDHGSSGYGLVTLLWHTLFLLPDQQAQIDCLAACARAVRPGGAVVVEAYARVPDAHEREGTSLAVEDLGPDSLVLSAARHDRLAQRLTIQTVAVTPAGAQMLPIELRYAWPAELDLIARLAGLRLEHRWGDWDRAPFSSHHPHHVSVYRRPHHHLES